MDATEISKRLFDTAVKRARSREVRLGEGADSYIHVLSGKAADEIIRYSNATNSSVEPLVRSCELIFETLIDEMLLARKNIPGYQTLQPNIIGEQTLAAALKELCPMWPIC